MSSKWSQWQMDNFCGQIIKYLLKNSGSRILFDSNVLLLHFHFDSAIMDFGSFKFLIAIWPVEMWFPSSFRYHMSGKMKMAT